MYSETDLQYLNSSAGLQYMISGPEQISFDKVLRYIKYENELKQLQEELVKMQQWLIASNKRLCILFEGRDSAGKGGAIRRITHYINPRHFRVEALPKPTEIEKGQWYFQRYVSRLPDPGEIVFFDRSWYNRAVVEPVNGFCTKDEYDRFMSEINHFEEMITNDGIQLIKLYFSITKEEQATRFEDLKNDPLKVWKLSPVDLKAQELWDSYTDYKELMFAHTNTDANPWVILEANRKTKARTAAIKHVLDVVPYNREK